MIVKRSKIIRKTKGHSHSCLQNDWKTIPKGNEERGKTKITLRMI